MSLQTIIHAARLVAVATLRPIVLAGVLACACFPSLAADAVDDGAKNDHRITKRGKEPKSYIVGGPEATELYRACAVDQRRTACKLLIKGDEAKGFATARAVAFAHITLGRLAERDGNAALALKYYRQAQRRDPSLSLLDEKIEELAAIVPQKDLGGTISKSQTPQSVSSKSVADVPRDRVPETGAVQNSQAVGEAVEVASDPPQTEDLADPTCPPSCDYEATFPITTGSIPSVDRESAYYGESMDAQARRAGRPAEQRTNIPEAVIRESSPTLEADIDPTKTSRVAAIAAVFQPSVAPAAGPQAKHQGQLLQLTMVLAVLSVMTLGVLWSSAFARPWTVPKPPTEREMPSLDVLGLPPPEPAPIIGSTRSICIDAEIATPDPPPGKTHDAMTRGEPHDGAVSTSLANAPKAAREACVDTFKAAPRDAPDPVPDVNAIRLVLSGLADQVCREARAQARRPHLDSRLLQPMKTATQEILELYASRAPKEALLFEQDRSRKGPSGEAAPSIAALAAELTAVWSAILRRLPIAPFRVAGPHQKISFPARCLFDALENKQELLNELVAIVDGAHACATSAVSAGNRSATVGKADAGKKSATSSRQEDDPTPKEAADDADPGKGIRALFEGGPIAQVFDLKVFEKSASRPNFSFVFARDHAARADLIAARFASDLQQLFDRQAMTLILDRRGRLASHVREFIATDGELKARDAFEEIYPADRKWAGALNPFDLDLSSLDHFDKEKLLGAAMDIQTQAFENLVGPEVLRGKTHVLRHLLRAAHTIPNASLETLVNLLQPNALDRFANELAGITSRSTRNFFETEFQDQACRDFVGAFRSALSRVLEDYRLRQLTCTRASAGLQAKLFRPGTITVFDFSLMGLAESASNPFALMCLASLQTRRLVMESQGASLHLAAYVDDIAACLGGTPNCDEILFRQVGPSTLNLSLGVASAKDRRRYASVADRAF